MNRKNKLKYIILTGLLMLFTACPAPILDPDNECGSTVTLPDKGAFSPEDKIFNVGDTLSLLISFPSEIETENDSFINIFETYGSNNNTSPLSLSLSELLDGNEYKVTKGALDDDFRIIVNYSEDTNLYEFFIEIILLKEGFYDLNDAGSFDIEFGNSDDCSNRLIIETGIKNSEPQDSLNPGNYIFTVN